MGSTTDSTFKQATAVDVDDATLIEGLPGHGLVASIAVEQITHQLNLAHHGSITADRFPPVATYDDGLIQDLVRVYACESPPVMTLKSDLALPRQALEPLSDCVLNDLSDRFDQAIFLAGAPAQTEEQLGDVLGVGTTDPIKQDLEEAGVTVPDAPGVVGGITGALVRKCYERDVPAALLIVRAHPQLPDPAAAKAVIESALEPLVDFQIDTTPLDEQAEEIQQRMEQIATQYRSMLAEQENGPEMSQPGMFQ